MVSELKTDSATLTKPEEIADCLNSHFTAIGPRLASEIPSDHIGYKPEDLLNALRDFNLRKSVPTRS